MKKLWSIILVCMLCLSLAACGGDSSVPEQPEEEIPTTQDTSEESPDTSDGGNMEGSGNLGKYDVEIKDAVLTEDYDGNPAIVITYAWTNNSDETTSAIVALLEKAFQDGVELDTAFIMDSEKYDADASMKDIRPGATLEVQAAYTLANTTSEVEFEVSDWTDFSSDSVVMKTFDPSTL